jgi:hypothetical protein
MLLYVLLNDCVTFFRVSIAALEQIRLIINFLPSVVVVVGGCFNCVRVISMPFLSFKAFFLQWNISDDIIIHCNGFLPLWRCFCFDLIRLF